MMGASSMKVRRFELKGAVCSQIRNVVRYIALPKVVSAEVMGELKKRLCFAIIMCLVAQRCLPSVAYFPSKSARHDYNFSGYRRMIVTRDISFVALTTVSGEKYICIPHCSVTFISFTSWRTFTLSSQGYSMPWSSKFYLQCCRLWAPRERLSMALRFLKNCDCAGTCKLAEVAIVIIV